MVIIEEGQEQLDFGDAPDSASAVPDPAGQQRCPPRVIEYHAWPTRRPGRRWPTDGNADGDDNNAGR